MTVTLNAALDVTYRVDAVVLGATHRVSSVAVRAGGKGVNVARVLRALSVPVVATGLVGGGAGSALCAELGEAGVPQAMFPIAGETRRTVTVVSASGEATLFSEPGPEVSAAEWSGFLGHYRELVADADVVVLSGSLPRGLATDAYATLVRASPAPVVLDADGPALVGGAAAGPAVITPNRAELAAASTVDDPLALVPRPRWCPTALRDDRAHRRGTWTAAPPEVVTGNPTGRRRCRGGARRRLAPAVARAPGRSGRAVGGRGARPAGRRLRPCLLRTTPAELRGLEQCHWFPCAR
ncbi:1-phosphofructokinase family hexose kinase [Lentzea guizhouensis]|uniref:1-phosphofructokinase family hexose kinase n=1 Tax=Lentzea guizhouensis TaxID=1586287 RepID=UPI001C54D455|nr:PfkB family carbohydrate kinase [Lentzea guizhouensis]